MAKVSADAVNRSKAAARAFARPIGGMSEANCREMREWWAMQGLNLRPHPCEGCAALLLAFGFASKG